MLETSKDLLFIVIAAAVALLAVFTAWVLYEVASALRKANQILASVKEKIEKIDSFFEHLKEKVASSTSYFSLIASAATELVKFLKSRKESRRKK